MLFFKKKQKQEENDKEYSIQEIKSYKDFNDEEQEKIKEKFQEYFK